MLGENMKYTERRQQLFTVLEKNFIEQRRRKRLEDIKVSDICRQTNISRPTYYHYFQDVFDMSEKVENWILERQFSDFTKKGCIYTDSLSFFEEVGARLNEVHEELQILGKGRELEQLRKIEGLIVKLAKRGDTLDEELYLTVIVAGATETYHKYFKGTTATPAKSALLGRFINTISTMFEMRERMFKAARTNTVSKNSGTVSFFRSVPYCELKA